MLPMLALGGLAATNEFDCLRFLSNQPPIYELVFSLQQATPPPTFYFLQCQGSNFVVREASDPGRLRGGVSQMDDKDRCYGYCDGEVWSVRMYQGRALYFHGTKAQVPFMVEPLYDSCTEPLRLGLRDVDFHTIAWKGDVTAFSGISRGERQEGRIHRNDKRQIVSADYWIVPDKLDRHWFLKYDYGTNTTIPAGFPSAYQRSWTMGPIPERRLESTRILSLVLATNRMPRELFKAERFLDTPRDMRHFQENPF
jgi:hypothetical protein